MPLSSGCYGQRVPLVPALSSQAFSSEALPLGSFELRTETIPTFSSQQPEAARPIPPLDEAGIWPNSRSFFLVPIMRKAVFQKDSMLSIHVTNFLDDNLVRSALKLLRNVPDYCWRNSMFWLLIYFSLLCTTVYCLQERI